MSSKTIYFSRAITALKYGFQYLDIEERDIILVPDFICESIFYPILQNKIKFVSYELENDLSPKWSKLDSLVTQQTKAILMVHYFGQPQNINRFSNFCKKHSLYLIEDNAHGHSGVYNGKELGTFGDIGISSPRKFNSCGGILYLNDNFIKKDILPELNYKKINNGSNILFLLNKFPKLKLFLKNKLKKRLRYEDPRACRDIIIKEDFFIDRESILSIINTDWAETRKLRQSKFIDLKKIALDGGLRPIFLEAHLGSNPWCFPAYAKNQSEAIKWFDWGWKNNVDVFSWPPLREAQIKDGNEAYERWKRVVCFSTAF